MGAGDAVSTECLICGELRADARYAIHVPGTDVCEACAERVANAFWMTHSGRWLTWDNPPSKKPVKAKIPRSLAKQVYERDAYRCVQCGDHHDLTCDHIEPESLGGPTTFDNLQTMCRPCNSRKGVA